MSRRGRSWRDAVGRLGAPLLVAVLASACRDPPPATAASTRALVISVPWQIDTLDPHARDLLGQLAVSAHLYEPLVRKDRDMRLQPCLATRWINPDPLTWIFYLRPDVRFHDGQALTSADVVASLERVMGDPALQVGVYASEIARVTATGPASVEIRTRRPAAVLLNALSAIAIVPRGATGEALGSRPDGTGPYRLAGWTPGVSVALVRNDTYWGAAPAVPRVVLRLARSPDDGLRDLLDGESDVAQVGSRSAAASLQGQAGVSVVRRGGVFLKYLGMDAARAVTPYVPAPRNPFRDARVRRAMSLAIDRRKLVAQLPTFATPASQLVPSEIFGFAPALTLGASDTAPAQALMRAAGWPDGFEVTLHARREVSPAGPALAEMLGRVGIRVAVRELDEPSFYRAVEEPPTLFLTRYGCDTGDAGDVLNAGIHSPDAARHLGTANYGGYRNAGLDDAIEQSGEVLDPVRRRGQLQAIMATVMDELPWVPLYFDEDVYAVRAPYVLQPRADSYVLAAEVGLR
jgi:peptide/nickel transport system substrate-binding protein